MPITARLGEGGPYFLLTIPITRPPESDPFSIRGRDVQLPTAEGFDPFGQFFFFFHFTCQINDPTIYHNFADE